MIRTASEFLALQMARRLGRPSDWRDWDRIAATVGLTALEVRSLLKNADATAVATRRAILNAYTLSDAEDRTE